MEPLRWAFDFILHVDRHLHEIVQRCGGWTYGVLFLIVFCETGLVVTPLLPGDSLLFAAGAIAAGGSLDVWALFATLTAAAVLGDTVNYRIGQYLGPKVLQRENARFLKKEHLDRTRRFFEKYGGKTIIFARFVPIVRTFAPFLAGVGSMTYGRFLVYNVAGGLAWVAAFLYAGFAFGNLPVVRKHFTLVIGVIIVLSLAPMAVEYLRSRRRRPPEAPPGGPPANSVDSIAAVHDNPPRAAPE